MFRPVRPFSTSVSGDSKARLTFHSVKLFKYSFSTLLNLTAGPGADQALSENGLKWSKMNIHLHMAELSVSLLLHSPHLHPSSC